MAHICGYCAVCLAIATAQPNSISQESRGQVGIGSCCNCGLWSPNLHGAMLTDTKTKHCGKPPQYPGHRRTA